MSLYLSDSLCVGKFAQKSMDFPFEPSLPMCCEPESALIIGESGKVVKLVDKLDNVFETVLGNGVRTGFALTFFAHLFVVLDWSVGHQPFLVEEKVLVNATKCLHCVQRGLAVDKGARFLVRRELNEHDRVSTQLADFFFEA